MAVTYDASSKAHDAHPASSPLTWAHTCSGSDRLLIVCVMTAGPDAETVTAVTYNGVALTLVGGVTVGTGTEMRRSEIWRLIAPATGAHNVAISFSATDQDVRGMAISFTNTNQTIPTGTFVSASGNGYQALVEAASAEDELVIDSLIRYAAQSTTPGSGQTLRQYYQESGDFSYYAYVGTSTKLGSIATQMSWTWGGTTPRDWALAAAAVREVNRAPYAPTGLVRASFDADAAGGAVLSWTFNDPDTGDTQAYYQVKVIRVEDSVEVYDSGKCPGSSGDLMAHGTCENDKQYQWKVKTWDQDDAEGDYSELATFWCSAKPTAAITYPAIDNDDVSGPSLTATWTYNDPESEPQSAYQVRLLTTGDVELWSSGKVFGADVEAVVGYELVNGVSYKLKVKLWDAKDVVSTEVTRLFDAVFTNPPTPTLVVTGEDSSGRIKLVITNPAPTPPEPDFDHNDIYRRVSGDSAWVRIAADIAEDATYYDYAVASGVTYEYKVRAYGTTGTYADSTTGSDSITFTGVWMHDVSSPSTTVHRYPRDGSGRSSRWAPESTQLQFAGRDKPVAEFGESNAWTVQPTIMSLPFFVGDTDRTTLEALAALKATICYRDGAGRRLFGVIPEVAVSDEQWGYNVTFSFVETDYSEEV